MKNINLQSSIRNDLILHKKPRTNYFKDSFSYFSMKIWNDIPVNIISVYTIQSFKYLYKAHLLKYIFYLRQIVLIDTIYIYICKC